MGTKCQGLAPPAPAAAVARGSAMRACQGDSKDPIVQSSHQTWLGVAATSAASAGSAMVLLRRLQGRRTLHTMTQCNAP